MANRFFPNVMPDFVSENPKLLEEDKEKSKDGVIQIHEQGTEDSLLRLLSLPYPVLSQQLQRTALDLKETLLVDTWGLTGQRVENFTLYTGTLGTAFLLFKSFQIVKACDSSSVYSRDVTFICGRAGVCALGAMVAKYLGVNPLLDYYLTQFKEIRLSKDHPDELLYRRVGYLWACLFINKHLGKEKIPSSSTDAIIKEIIKSGRKLGKKGGGEPIDV